jgi:predicted DNA binding CopG/RHH family protein
MSLSVADRFNRGLLATTKFQVEEKQNRDTKDLAKLENIRKYQKTIMKKVEDENARLSERDLSKVKAMGLAQWSYEHVKI